MQKSLNVLMAKNECNRKAKKKMEKLYIHKIQTRCCSCGIKVFHNLYIQMVKLKRVWFDLISLDLKNIVLHFKIPYQEIFPINRVVHCYEIK